MKDKAFARAVSRDDLKRGADELGIPLEEHVGNVISFLRVQAGPLGLTGNL
jgi:predicted hydrolase (HD superfamily)